MERAVGRTMYWFHVGQGSRLSLHTRTMDGGRGKSCPFDSSRSFIGPFSVFFIFVVYIGEFFFSSFVGGGEPHGEAGKEGYLGCLCYVAAPLAPASARVDRLKLIRRVLRIVVMNPS